MQKSDKPSKCAVMHFAAKLAMVAAGHHFAAVVTIAVVVFVVMVMSDHNDAAAVTGRTVPAGEQGLGQSRIRIKLQKAARRANAYLGIANIKTLILPRTTPHDEEPV